MEKQRKIKSSREEETSKNNDNVRKHLMSTLEVKEVPRSFHHFYFSQFIHLLFR